MEEWIGRLEAMSMPVAVVETGSFSAAIRALQVPLATLSREVSDLERVFAARLIVRTARRLSLTDVGIAYVAVARRILGQVEEAEREAAGCRPSAPLRPFRGLTHRGAAIPK